MRRSSSMDQAVSILDTPTIFSSDAESEAVDLPAPLPRSPEPKRSSSSTHYSSFLTPISYTPSDLTDISFGFLDDISPGIPLISSSSSFSGDENMGTIDVRTDSHSFYQHHGSLDSFDDDLPENSEVSLSRQSQPRLYFTYDNEEALNDSQRSRSLGDLINNEKPDQDSSYSSLDRMRRGSIASNNNNHEKGGDYDPFSASPHFSTDSPDDLPEEGYIEAETFEYVTEASSVGEKKFLDLLPISEENEETGRSRHSSMHGSERRSVDFGIPEPATLAPGTSFPDIPFPMYEPIKIQHRRAISDNPVPHDHKIDADFLPTLEPLPMPAMVRNALGRASNSGRCLSQVYLSHDDELPPVLATSDRSLSKSDPAIEDKIDNDETDNSQTDENIYEVPICHAPAPPPVLLTRKNSVVKPDSWKAMFSHGGATPHTVVTPVTAALGPSSRSTSKLSASTDTQNKSKGVEKRKSEGSTLFGSLFGTNKDKSKKNRPKLEQSTFLEAGSSLPVRHERSVRPTIPSNLTEGLNWAYSGLTGALPDRLTQKVNDLPDPLNRVFSPTAAPDTTDLGSPKVDYIQNIVENPRYARLDIFNTSLHNSWTEKYNSHMLGLPKKAQKKQDAIYELIHLERQHCANLAFLQDGYRLRLIEENILTRDEVNRLIPDVIEALLIFHLNLLERLQNRQKENIVVETIADIMEHELADTGEHTKKCIEAYTTFGAMKGHCEHNWTNSMQKNQKFAEFIKRCNIDKIYRTYDFSSIMTRTIARPARYGFLMESIRENDANKWSESYKQMERATDVCKKFALRINNNLQMLQMSKKWEEIKKNFDTSSQTRLFIADTTVPEGYVTVLWNLDSIAAPMNTAGGRRIMIIGEANVKSHQQNKSNMLNVTAICFDDILVFLVNKNGKYSFAPLDQPVITLHCLLLRPLAGHSLNVMLIPPVKPALVDVQFQSKNDLAKWQKALELTIRNAPHKVRLSKRESDEYLRQTTYEHEKQEKKQKEAEETWMKHLIDLFERHGTEELAMFSSYMGKRSEFSMALQSLLEQIPLRGRPDLIERVKESVRAKFKELRNMKTVPIKKLINDMTQAKEAMLFTYLQELEEGNSPQVDDSDGSGSDSSGSGRLKPRRIKTFNGTTVESTSKSKSSGIRRHTTVPRMGTKEEEVVDEAEEREREQQVDEMNHALPLTQPTSTNRECRRLIRDLERLKTENLALKNEVALDKLRIASLEKMRSSSTTLPSSVEAMEVLRRKEKEIKEEEIKSRKMIEKEERELQEERRKMEEAIRHLEVEKSNFARQEALLNEQWATINATNGGNISPPRISTSRINYDYPPKITSYNRCSSESANRSDA